MLISLAFFKTVHTAPEGGRKANWIDAQFCQCNFFLLAIQITDPKESKCFDEPFRRNSKLNFLVIFFLNFLQLQVVWEILSGIGSVLERQVFQSKLLEMQF